jgi:hypothetical protein
LAMRPVGRNLFQQSVQLVQSMLNFCRINPAFH